MEPSKQADNYDKIADHWASENFNRDNGIEQHKRALQILEKKDKAIDVGCGSSGRIIALLLNDGFDVEGIDLSIEMLSLAQKKILTLSFIMLIFVSGNSQKNMILSQHGIAFGMHR